MTDQNNNNPPKSSISSSQSLGTAQISKDLTTLSSSTSPSGSLLDAVSPSLPPQEDSKPETTGSSPAQEQGPE